MRAWVSGPRTSAAVGGTGAAVAVAAALVLAVVAGCGSPTPRAPAAGHGGGGRVTGEDITTGLIRWEPAQRPVLPAVHGRTLDGGNLDVADWRGQVVVVNAWGSWCGPCRREAPDLRRVSLETRAHGVRFVGIDTRDSDAAGREFVREFRIGYPSIVDGQGRVMLGLRDIMPVSAVPTTVVVDSVGRVAARVIGPVTYAALHGLVEDTVAETRTETSKKGGS